MLKSVTIKLEIGPSPISRIDRGPAASEWLEEVRRSVSNLGETVVTRVVLMDAE